MFAAIISGDLTALLGRLAELEKEKGNTGRKERKNGKRKGRKTLPRSKFLATALQITDSLNLLNYCSAADFTHRIEVIFVGEVELVDLRFEGFEYFAVTCHVGGQYQHDHTLQCIHNDPQTPASTEIQSKTKRKLSLSVQTLLKKVTHMIFVRYRY